MGRTSLVIDDELIVQAIELTGARSKREAVDIALKRLVARGKLHAALRRTKPRVTWEGSFGRPGTRQS